MDNDNNLNSSEDDKFSVPDTQESPAPLAEILSKDWVYADQARVLTPSTTIITQLSHYYYNNDNNIQSANMHEYIETNMHQCLK